jgi:hypothetical protein
MKEQEKRNPKDQQHESLKIGNQARLVEKVVEHTKHDQGAIDRARKRRFDATGEDSTTASKEDAVKERNLRGSKKSSGGAFDKKEQAPKLLGKK